MEVKECCLNPEHESGHALWFTGMTETGTYSESPQGTAVNLFWGTFYRTDNSGFLFSTNK